jgi:hypothetical protein
VRVGVRPRVQRQGVRRRWLRRELRYVRHRADVQRQPVRIGVRPRVQRQGVRRRWLRRELRYVRQCADVHERRPMPIVHGQRVLRQRDAVGREQGLVPVHAR